MGHSGISELIFPVSTVVVFALLAVVGPVTCHSAGRPVLTLGSPAGPSSAVASGAFRDSPQPSTSLENREQTSSASSVASCADSTLCGSTSNTEQEAEKQVSALQRAQTLLARTLQLAERSAAASEEREKFQRQEEEWRQEKEKEEGGCDNPYPFVPTTEWQEVCEGQVLPAGLHYRINLTTGKKEAKLL